MIISDQSMCQKGRFSKIRSHSGTALLLLVNHAYRIDTITPRTPIMYLLSVVRKWKPSRAYHNRHFLW